MHRTCHLPVGDFPDVAKFRGVMESHDLAKFPKVDMKLIDGMETVLSQDIPRLMSMFPQEGAGESTQVTDALTHVGANLAPTQQLEYKHWRATSTQPCDEERHSAPEYEGRRSGRTWGHGEVIGYTSRPVVCVCVMSARCSCVRTQRSGPRVVYPAGGLHLRCRPPF